MELVSVFVDDSSELCEVLDDVLAVELSESELAESELVDPAVSSVLDEVESSELEEEVALVDAAELVELGPVRGAVLGFNGAVDPCSLGIWMVGSCMPPASEFDPQAGKPRQARASRGHLRWCLAFALVALLREATWPGPRWILSCLGFFT